MLTTRALQIGNLSHYSASYMVLNTLLCYIFFNLLYSIYIGWVESHVHSNGMYIARENPLFQYFTHMTD